MDPRASIVFAMVCGGRRVRRWALLAVVSLCGTLLVVGMAQVAPAGADTVFGQGCAAVGGNLTSDTLHTVTPTRVLDSRTGNGGWFGKLAAGSPRSLQVTGVGGVPADASAITGNVIVTGGTANASITVWTTGASMPSVPLFAFTAGQTFPQTAAVAISAGGKINFATSAGAVDVIFDVSGYYAPSGVPCHDLAPVAKFDSTVSAATPASFAVTGGTVPATATAAVVRVEASGSSSSSFATPYPTGSAAPATSLLIFAAGQTVSNITTVALGNGGQLSLVTATGTVTVEVTVLAYLDSTTAASTGPGGTFAVTPAIVGAGEQVTATSAVDLGPFASTTFDWGDGTSSPGPNATHAYATAGQMRVRFTATSAAGTFSGDFYLVVVISPPGAPTDVIATPGARSATVTWTAPAADGGAVITSYTATATPGGKTCTSSSVALTCVVSGLTSGTSYSFEVRARNSVGLGASSSPSNAVIPWDGSGFHPVTPTRILDSRGLVGDWGGKLSAFWPKHLVVTNLGGPSNVPSNATAVVMNVTATDGTTGSFLTAWPTGAARPVSSNLNFGPGQTIPNLVTVKIGAGGSVAFANAAGSVHVVADVVGYYDDGADAGDLFNGITPARLLDSRFTDGGWNAQLAAGAPRDLVVQQPGNPSGVPATATAVIANVTVTAATEGSFLSVYPSGVSQPNVSNLNFAAGETIPNLVVVKIGTNGSISFANAVGAVDVIVDVVGYFDPTEGSRFHTIVPTRVLDGRKDLGLPGPWGPGQTRALAVAGAAGTNVPASATGLVTNVTATEGSTGSFLTVFPDGVAQPTSSNLNFGPGQTIPNLVTVKIGANGNINLYNELGTVHLIADVVGYYAPL